MLRGYHNGQPYYSFLIISVFKLAYFVAERFYVDNAILCACFYFYFSVAQYVSETFFIDNTWSETICILKPEHFLAFLSLVLILNMILMLILNMIHCVSIHRAYEKSTNEKIRFNTKD